jgi:hypothetical protein
VLIQGVIQAKFTKGFSADAKVSNFLLKKVLQIYEGICVRWMYQNINDVVTIFR